MLIFILGLIIGTAIGYIMAALLCTNNKDLEKENLQAYCAWLENEVRRLGGNC